MNFQKILLFSFLFFALGNFNAQNTDIQNQFLSKNIVFLEGYYRTESEKIKFENEKLKSLRNEYFRILNNKYKISEKLNKHAIFHYLQYYPDVNAVFFNRGNLLSDEKISEEEKQKYNALFLEISKQIPNEIYIELSKITDEINRDKFALTVPYRFEIFQDLFDENQRKRIDIINFLLWNVE